MAEVGAEISFVIPEIKKIDDDPPFLKKLSVDHPQVAEDIRKRIPEWKEKVDELSGVKDFGTNILNEIEYVGKDETDQLVNSVADEIRKIREGNPNKPIRFVAWSPNDGSGKWFYDQIIDSLQDTSTENISIIAPYNVVDRPDLKAYEPVYFYLDDAANSGQQIQQGINAFRRVIRNLTHSESRKEDEKAMIEKPIDLRIRLLRMTDKVKDFIDQQKKYLLNERGVPLVHIDIESNPYANKHMPTMDDLAVKLGLDENNVQNKNIFFYGHHGRYPTTLTGFRHKIQDNMPIILVEGKFSENVPFLISEENMKSIRNFYH